jgi:hypothetical protein
MTNITDTSEDEIIDITVEGLDFSDETPIPFPDDVPEMDIPILDDFLYFIPCVDDPLWNRVVNVWDTIGFGLLSFLVLSNPDKEQAQKKEMFVHAQVSAMIPHIARFQRFHLWEKNQWGQTIRNKHAVIHNRNIQRHWLN